MLLNVKRQSESCKNGDEYLRIFKLLCFLLINSKELRCIFLLALIYFLFYFIILRQRELRAFLHIRNTLIKKLKLRSQKHLRNISRLKLVIKEEIKMSLTVEQHLKEKIIYKHKKKE